MFIKDDFMLHSKTAKELYEMVKDMPIIDYHCHLSPKQIAENYRFKNAYDLFLGGDHYKWRQMRTNGIDEEYITGDKPDFDKFMAWAETMPNLIGNPLYHWTHLELLRYFNIDEPLSPESAKRIWDKCNALLEKDEYSARGLIERSNVEVVCTTDDPADSLEYHKQIAESGFKTKVLPTFRPDKAIQIENAGFREYLEQAGVENYNGLISWLDERIEFFHSMGCRLSDHALCDVPYAEGDAAAVLEKKLANRELSPNDIDIYKTAVLTHLAKRYTELDWAMQIHIGALRNNNSQMFKKLGPDTGFDSINDAQIAPNLAKLLDGFINGGGLPKIILYPLNPKDNYVIAAMIGNFQSAPVKGRLQFGSGWWFCDQRDGMREQMKALANLGILAHFVGMLTDSRSFVSYPRHEYFRRIMCDLIGGWVEAGEYPRDMKTLERIVRGISHDNARDYFGF